MINRYEAWLWYIGHRMRAEAVQAGCIEIVRLLPAVRDGSNQLRYVARDAWDSDRLTALRYERAYDFDLAYPVSQRDIIGIKAALTALRWLPRRPLGRRHAVAN